MICLQLRDVMPLVFLINKSIIERNFLFIIDNNRSKFLLGLFPAF